VELESLKRELPERLGKDGAEDREREIQATSDISESRTGYDKNIIHGVVAGNYQQTATSSDRFKA